MGHPDHNSEHTQGYECACGCRHEKHDDDRCGHHRDHGHHHEYTHTHELEHHYENGITISEHEGALVASVNLELTGTYDEAEQALAHHLERLAQTIEDAGGAIGHIKASLSGGGMVSTLSTTGLGSTTHIRRGSTACLHAEVVALVLAVSEEQLLAALSTLLSSPLPLPPHKN